MLGASVGLLCIPVLTRIFRPNDILAYSIVNCIAAFTVMISIVYWVVDYWAEPELDADLGGAIRFNLVLFDHTFRKNNCRLVNVRHLFSSHY